jgi:hypothetical protein
MKRIDWFSRGCWIAFATLFSLTCLLGVLWADEHTIIEDKRIQLSLDIAREYNLTRDQAILMLGIYQHELTPKKQMKTFGYFGIRKSMCPIIQYCKSDEMLFIVCAGLCAETIKKHCPNIKRETLNKFGKIYAIDPWWVSKVKRKMRKFENILY